MTKSNKTIKVVFECSHFNFHNDYIKNIQAELEKRGHIAIVIESCDKNNINRNQLINFYRNKHNDADFTIFPDEGCDHIGGKVIYINHALIPVIPQHEFYYNHDFKHAINSKVDYMFLPSQELVNLFEYELNIKKPYKIVGFPKLDNLINKRHLNTSLEDKLKHNIPINIMYSPTGRWKTTMNSENIVDINLLKKYGNLLYFGHPSEDKTNNSLLENLSIVDMLITDYSSVGYDSIVLNIPTIFIDHKHWGHITKKGELLCETARSAGIRVQNMNELIDAINTYKNNPTFLEKERQYFSVRLTKYKENSSKIFVDELLKL